MTFRRKTLTERARRAGRVQVVASSSAVLSRPRATYPAVTGEPTWSERITVRLPLRLDARVSLDGDNTTGRLTFTRFDYTKTVSGKEVAGSEAFENLQNRDLWEDSIADAVQAFVEKYRQVYGWTGASS